MDNNLQQGIAAAKAGDKQRAFDLLTRASENPETSEQAWLWLSGVVGDDSERLFCLDSVLKINANNVAAQRGAAMLRQKGVFPAVPVYPEPQPVASVQSFTSVPILSTESSSIDFATPAQFLTTSTKPGGSGYTTDWNKQELSSLFQYAVLELASNKSHQAVEKLLVGRGTSLETAKAIVKDAQYAVKKARRDKHKKRMTRGLIWTFLGVILTCGTYAFASELGGKYILFYGAIIFGFIDFIVGLIGWLASH
jgi:hypothetical protein